MGNGIKMDKSTYISSALIIVDAIILYNKKVLLVI